MVTDSAEAGTENEPVQGQPGRVTLYGLGTRTDGVTGGLRLFTGTQSVQGRRPAATLYGFGTPGPAAPPRGANIRD